MSCEGKIYIGQIGVILEVETQRDGCPLVDWSDSTLREIIVRLPDKTVVNYPASLHGSVLKFTTDSATHLPLAGNYLIQARLVGPTYDALGETAKFKVYDRWK